MKAAGNTVEFVKQWIAGTYTKRQYQNYYIVKTPHAQFLMKNTENRELLAIKDTTGHIYLFDDDLVVYGYGTPPTISDNNAMSNPFLCLLLEDYDFKYTRISPNSMARATVLLSTIGKWKTLDRVAVTNGSLPVPIYLSLVAVGDKRFFITPKYENEEKLAPRTPLAVWAQNGQEATYRFQHKWIQYSMSQLYSDKINTINEIKGNYVALAGDKLDWSWVNSDGWVFIPTDFSSIEEITGRAFREARRSRPNPYAYGLTGNGINMQNIYRRCETVEENAEALKVCINLRDEFDSGNWKAAIRDKHLAEIADDMIAFFEADDAWLREHFEIARAGALEAKFRSKVSMGIGSSLIYVNQEPNPSPMNEHVVYIKAQALSPNKFLKVLPTPVMASKIKGIFDGDN